MEDKLELPWVQNGAKLFKESDRYYESSHFGWGDITAQLFFYIEGYKTSADILVERAVSSKNTKELDTLIFPICFLYRHTVELLLKQIFLLYGQKSKQEKIAYIKKKSHNLHSLWEEIKPIILECSTTPEEKKDIEIAEKYLLELHNYDQKSFSFRYPIDKDQLQLVHDKEKNLDLNNLKDRIEELSNYLYACIEAIGIRKSI